MDDHSMLDAPPPNKRVRQPALATETRRDANDQGGGGKPATPLEVVRNGGTASTTSRETSTWQHSENADSSRGSLRSGSSPPSSPGSESPTGRRVAEVDAERRQRFQTLKEEKRRLLNSVKRGYRVPYSSMSAFEHQWFLMWSAQLAANPAIASNVREQQRFEDIRKVVELEKRERLAFFRKVFLCSDNIKRVLCASDDVIEVCRLHTTKQAYLTRTQEIPSTYSIHTSVALCDRVDPNPNKDVLTFGQVVCQLGEMPVVDVDRLTDMYQMEGARLVLGDKISTEALPRGAEDNGLSNALARMHNANAVLPDKTMRLLLSLVPGALDQAWQVPFRVETSPDGKKAVKFCDPLPVCSLSVREMLSLSAELCIQRDICSTAATTESKGPHFLPKGWEGEGGGQGHGTKARLLHEHLVSVAQNLTYTTWKFGPHDLLVRNTSDGVFGSAEGEEGACNRVAYVKAKAECSLYQGTETYTQKEIMDWWVTLFIQPSSHLLLGRIDSDSESVHYFDRLNRASVVHLGGPAFEPAIGIDNFYALLNMTKRLDDGSYMLVHRRGEARVLCFASVADDEVAESQAQTFSHLLLQERAPKVLSRMPDGSRRLYTIDGIDWGQRSDALEFIPPEWIPCLEVETCQIPDTFPPWLDGKPSLKTIFTQDKNIMHCRPFAKCNACIHGSQCTLPHLDRDAVNECKKLFCAYNNDRCRLDWWKSFVPQRLVYCFAHSAGQPCPYGGSDKCPYPHLDRSAIDEITSKLGLLG